MAIGSILHADRSFECRRHQGDEQVRAVFGLFDCGRKTQVKARNAIMDVIVVGIGVLFFALSIVYVKACNRI
ncbi:hypothetical protein C7I87_31130 [Mesorhizobium sp. SARCC-RB16n]|nr:hypothetical protein C7I87_31130 [Mesorhizobium sp. SARCC-RB16n]